MAFSVQPENEEEKDEDKVTWRFWKKRRYIVGVLAFLGFFTSYILRVNLSVAIVAMTANSSNIDENGKIYYVSSSSYNKCRNNFFERDVYQIKPGKNHEKWNLSHCFLIIFHLSQSFLYKEVNIHQI